MVTNLVNFPTEKTVKWIGFICNVNSKKELNIHLGIPYWIMRIITMEEILCKNNYKLFAYSPADVDLQTLTVKGYYFMNSKLTPIELPIPQINYDYYFGKSGNDPKNGPSLGKFVRICSSQLIQVYNQRDVTLLSKDKYQTHEFFLDINKDLVPSTIVVNRDNIKLQELLVNYHILFIKPRFGKMGNGIIVVKKIKEVFVTTFYKNMKIFTNAIANVEQLESYVLSMLGKEEYIIQQGIDGPRINGSAFDIRVSMLNDGSKWRTIHLVRVGAANSDISNLSQGGSVLETHEALFHIFSKNEIERIISEIKNYSIEIAECLNQKFEHELIEISLDYILDKQGRIYVAEINTKPGLSGIPEFYVDGFLNMTVKEQYIYENYSMPHGRYLAEFLLKKLKLDH